MGPSGIAPGRTGVRRREWAAILDITLPIVRRSILLSGWVASRTGSRRTPPQLYDSCSAEQDLETGSRRSTNASLSLARVFLHLVTPEHLEVVAHTQETGPRSIFFERLLLMS